MRPDPAATVAHWNRLAADYDAAKARNSTYFDGLKALFAAAIPAGVRGRVLDVGCGTGQVLAHLEPAEGLGIDASPAMIARARAAHAGRTGLRFEVRDAADAAEAGPFDAVVSADLLEHVPDWAAAVDAMVAACRPGGTIVISTPSPAWALPLWVLETLRLKMPEGPHAFVPRRAIARRLETRGCRILDARAHLAVPARLGGLGPALSRLAAAMPVGRRLGVAQVIVAERGDGREAER